jgi:hypothetical protein
MRKNWLYEVQESTRQREPYTRAKARHAIAIADLVNAGREVDAELLDAYDNARQMEAKKQEAIDELHAEYNAEYNTARLFELGATA